MSALAELGDHSRMSGVHQDNAPHSYGAPLTLFKLFEMLIAFRYFMNTLPSSL